MIPKYLYHYTSIETLKKIIETRKIRFTRLDKLNDPYEGFIEVEENVSIDQARKCVYCSCWTDKEQESVNLWAIYTKFTMHGVRIKMKPTMFSNELVLQEYVDGFIPKGSIQLNEKYRYMDTDEPIEIKSIFGPFKVDYVDTLKETYKSALLTVPFHIPDVINIPMHNIFIRELGLKKVKHWEYENEWRYKFSLQETFAGCSSALSRIPASLIVCPEYIDIPYRMPIEEIVVGPYVSGEEINSLNNYLRKQRIDLKVQVSKIKINF